MTESVKLCVICMHNPVHFENLGSCEQCNFEAVEHNYIERFIKRRSFIHPVTGQKYFAGEGDKLDMHITNLLAHRTFLMNPMDYGDMLKRIVHNGLEDTFADIHRETVDFPEDEAIPVAYRLSLNEEIANRNRKEDVL